MDTSFTIKPRDTTVRRATGRNNVVRTDLAPSLSVNAGQQSSISDHAAHDSGSHDPTLNPQCHTLLNREREARKQRRESKDDALLRQKAYARNTVLPAPAADQDTPRADLQV